MIETLKTSSYCQYNSISLDCGGEIIAVESIVYAYRVGCESQCCSFVDSDCFVNASVSDVQYVRRICSGRHDCILDLSSSINFCSFGTQAPSYVTIQFYCIPGKTKEWLYIYHMICHTMYLYICVQFQQNCKEKKLHVGSL